MQSYFRCLENKRHVFAVKGNGSVAYDQSQLAIRELLGVLALTESTYAEGATKEAKR